MQDSGPESDPAPGPAPAPPPENGAPGASPYRNLWVPLVVVPFLVVGVLVLVFLFFGAIGGRESSLEDNLQVLVQGGTNQRQQAAFNLGAQVSENQQALRDGREPPWEVGPGFLGKLQAAWEAMAEDDNLSLRLTLAKVLVEQDDPEVLGKLLGFLELTDGDDPEGQIRFGALEGLTILGDPAAAPAVIPFLDHPDPYLQLAAASALQVMPGEASSAALRGVLGSPSLELRGRAAISLSHFGDASGAHVLVDLADPATYEAIRAESPRKYADPKLVQNSRIHAVRALARLRRDQDLELLQGLADGDEDPAVREAAMRALAER